MTAFVADAANSNRTPFNLKELEDFITALRIQSKAHSTSRPAPKRMDKPSHDLWRPSRLDPSISANQLPIPIQCMYAISTIYDVAIQRQYRPTAKMISAMLSTFIGHLTPQQMEKATDATIRHLIPPSAFDQDIYLRKINHAALATLISTYGYIGKPDKGEVLLRRWAEAQKKQDTPEHASPLQDSEAVSLTGWGNNTVIWKSLIKSRVEAGDFAHARAWLDRYRQATKHSQIDQPPGSTPLPPVTPEPYLAYLSGIQDSAGHAPSSKLLKRINRRIQDGIRIMIADNVPVESSVLAFIIGFEAKVGNVAGGASLVDELSSVIEASALDDAHLLRALFQMRRAIADAQTATSVIGPAFRSVKKNGPPSTRSLVRSLVRVGDGEVKSTSQNLASCRSRGTLNEALIAVMSEQDYPAAVAVLNLFERWRILPSHTTYRIVVDALVAQGHHRALHGQQGEVKDSESKFSLEAILQSMARDGNGEQGNLIRRALGPQSTDETEGFIASARPTTLRQTQYLIRILNRVCAAEIESIESKRKIPEWVITRRNAERDMEGWLTENAVWKRVRSAIYTAQDDMLGTKQERRIGIKANPKKRLLTSLPTLSPRRRGINNPPRSQSARSFSTSAVARLDSGASCDLAAAAKGDFTHLNPVRMIYIPGFVPYHLGLALQEHLVKQRSDARATLRALADTSSDSTCVIAGLTTIEPSASEAELRKRASQDTLLLLQHRPVYTEGRRHDSENELVSNHLRSLGADYYLTKRGGQITYHGPGQLVGYPILNLASMNLASRCYVDRIQDSLISLLADGGIRTVPPPEDHTGVWADEYHKIASIGIQVRHRISSHGFALNVEKRAMQGFRHIVACGIVGRNMTCVQDRFDPNGPFAKYNVEPKKGVKVDSEEKVESVAETYKHHFAKVFGRRVRDVIEDEFKLELVEESKRDLLKKGLNIDVSPEERVVSAIKVDGQTINVA
ncbi:uncharacterized protein MEPE_03287 [Melanopsichium pennsylvanicum]|uniref:lipoyl(octanoyl) transferase n=2 Tax=Melanopsichium pennsylvanicum TaxID=63383 RepID=A0AAJ4XP37_9BASI|nr:uncharacterized protein MEPE_03287 [Melanopsichium pennsylvanicum]